MNAPEDVRDRLALIIHELDKNPNSFAVAIGVPGAQIYNIVKGKRNKPSFDLLVKIVKTFPQINLEYLIIGEGDILKRPDEPQTYGLTAEEPMVNYGSPSGAYNQRIDALEKKYTDLYEKYDQVREKYIKALEKGFEL